MELAQFARFFRRNLRAMEPGPASCMSQHHTKDGAICPHCVARAPREAGRALVKVYRYTLSPLIGFHCRHLPTCSEYADEALSRFGLWAGGWMTLARLLRCHPYGTSGLDFVAKETPAGAKWWIPWRYGRWRGTNETAL